MWFCISCRSVNCTATTAPFAHSCCLAANTCKLALVASAGCLAAQPQHIAFAQRALLPGGIVHGKRRAPPRRFADSPRWLPPACAEVRSNSDPHPSWPAAWLSAFSRADLPLHFGRDGLLHVLGVIAAAARPPGPVADHWPERPQPRQRPGVPGRRQPPGSAKSDSRSATAMRSDTPDTAWK